MATEKTLLQGQVCETPELDDCNVEALILQLIRTWVAEQGIQGKESV